MKRYRYKLKKRKRKLKKSKRYNIRHSKDYIDSLNWLLKQMED